ncbi:ribonuclease H-like domain-containing protein [Tanacetum coccineum]
MANNFIFHVRFLDSQLVVIDVSSSSSTTVISLEKKQFGAFIDDGEETCPIQTLIHYRYLRWRILVVAVILYKANLNTRTVIKYALAFASAALDLFPRNEKITANNANVEEHIRNILVATNVNETGAIMAIMISSLDQSNPLHIHPNDSDCASIVNVKLTGVENYRVWASAVKLALQIKNKMGF